MTPEREVDVFLECVARLIRRDLAAGFYPSQELVRGFTQALFWGCFHDA